MQLEESQISKLERALFAVAKSHLCWALCVILFNTYRLHQFDYLTIPFGLQKIGVGIGLYGYLILPIVGIFYSILALESDVKRIRNKAWIAFGLNCLFAASIWLCYAIMTLFPTDVFFLKGLRI